MKQVSLLSPAKLNCFLHITGQRANGYHELQSVFQLLDFGDLMHFRVRSDNQILIHGQTIPLTENLIYKAASCFRSLITQQHSTQPCNTPSFGVDITIQKRIPTGAGMGGGSSNAATTLKALNVLWRNDLSAEAISQLGLSLGADIPFFLQRQTAFVEGVGETIHPIPLQHYWYVLVKPPQNLSTQAVFTAPELNRNSKKMALADFFSNENPIYQVPWDKTYNDCEKVASTLCKPVAEIIKWLGQYGPARLTGTGSCCFLPCNSAIEAFQIKEKFLKDWADTTCFVAVSRGITSAP